MDRSITSPLLVDELRPPRSRQDPDLGGKPRSGAAAIALTIAGVLSLAIVTVWSSSTRESSSY
ncbi:hypothetical protein AB0M47_38825 [Hamadaea sp. NPDC051192]|uniref:hypothetical protein n=1 Tax=Hamadaea sp. NPDC051192 TaxID=3154940 RepID=UPI00341275FE